MGAGPALPKALAVRVAKIRDNSPMRIAVFNTYVFMLFPFIK